MAMTEFRYTALDSQGHEVTGALQAESRAAALARLKGMGMHALGLESGSNGAGAALNGGGAPAPVASTAVVSSPGFSLFQKGVSGSDLSLFTRQLASLFNAGLNVGRSLSTLIDHCEQATLKTALEGVQSAVQSGSTLWEALSEHPKIFDELYVNLVRAGEASGQLGPVLERLADTLETQEEYRSRLRSALAYPTLLLTAGFGAVLFILLFLVPRFSKIFASLNKPLPAPTKALIATQMFVSQWWWLLLIGAFALITLFRWYDRTEQGGLALDRIRMRIPVMGSIVHKDSIARFCRTMATLVKGGVPILMSFEVAERAVGNRVLRQAIVQVRGAVREGEGLAPPLRRTGVFPGLVTNMIAVGEETGNLDEMLGRVADAYDAEVGNRLRQAVSLVEPAVILLMGGIIGTIVISMLVPVLELSTAF
jgi:general secretion pathway protein F